jgi:hypothetical protein
MSINRDSIQPVDKAEISSMSLKRLVGVFGLAVALSATLFLSSVAWTG